MEQKMKATFWQDETGNKIPVSRITRCEKNREKELAKLLKSSKQANAILKALKKQAVETCDNLIEEFLQEKGIDMIGRGKGNVTFYNFDRSIKLEVNASDRIAFDDLLILACKDKFDSYMQKNVIAKDDFAKSVIEDAFTTVKGKLDTKKVINLLRYEDRSNDAEFTEAMSLLRQAIRKPGARSYYRVSLRNAQGEYEVIELNFSNI